MGPRKKQWMRFKGGVTHAVMRNSEYFNYVELVRQDECPGAGWYPVSKVLPKPEVPEGDELAYSWTLRDGVAVKEYMLASQIPRTFSKLKVVSELMKAGVWQQVKEYIEQAGLYDLYLAAQDFAEDNEYFTAGKAQLQSELGWTDEQVESVLAASVSA